MSIRRLLIAFLAVSLSAVARADDGGPNLNRPGIEFGGGYRYSTGRVGYNYYSDTTTSLLVSRLTYDQLAAGAGELYFRGDVSWGLFVKGLIGAGCIGGAG
jgi:hypothetical protein